MLLFGRALLEWCDDKDQDRGFLSLPESIGINNVAIFDGRALLSANSVLIEDGHIAALGQDIINSTDITCIDGAGCMLLPGLIDAHVHVWQESQLRQALIFGVTTQLDMFAHPRDISYLKAQA